MSRFTDALNNPLPSKVNGDSYIKESDEFDDILRDEPIQASDLNAGYADEGGCAGSSCEDTEFDDDDDDDFDPDDMSDEELAALDAELSSGAVDTVIGDDNDDEVDLSPDEEIEADDMMSVAATTMLVNDELNAEEKVNFIETQGSIAVNEGFMTEYDLNELMTESELVQEAKYTNKMIIRLDAASKKKQLYALAVNVSAAAHGDPDYYKLKKVMKMRKILRAKLERKYKSEANKRMKIYFNRLRRSKAPDLAKIAKKIDK